MKQCSKPDRMEAMDIARRIVRFPLEIVGENSVHRRMQKMINLSVHFLLPGKNRTIELRYKYILEEEGVTGLSCNHFRRDLTMIQKLTAI